VPDPGSEPPKESSGKGPGLRTRQRNERREQGHSGQALRPGGVRPFSVLHGRSPRRAQTARGDGPRGCAAEEDGSARTSPGTGRAYDRPGARSLVAGGHRARPVCDGPRPVDRCPARPRRADCARSASGRRRGYGPVGRPYPGARRSRWCTPSRPPARACASRRTAGPSSRAAPGRRRRGSGSARRPARSPNRRPAARRRNDRSAASGCTASRPGRSASGIAGRPGRSTPAHGRPASGQQPVLRTAGDGTFGSAAS